MMSYLDEEPDASVPPILRNLKRLEQDMRLAGDAAFDVPLSLMRNIKDDLHELNSLLRRRREEESRGHTDGSCANATGGETSWAQHCRQQDDDDAAAAVVSVSLDSQLWRCLSCLSAFPPEQSVKKSLLVHWWIGEGVVSSVQEAKECIDKLLRARLVVPVRRPHCHKAHAFAAPRSLRSLLQEADMADTGALVARLLVTDTRFHPQPQLGVGGGDGNGGAVTAYNIHGRYMCLEKEWMANQTSMRVLQLGQWRSSSSSAAAIQHQHEHVEVVGGTGFLERVGACRRSLRYLSLRGVSVVDSLPDQIGELGNLVVLDLHACHNLETLPDSVGSLAMLEYLDVSSCYLLDQMPRTVANLSRLEVLKGFVASRAPPRDAAETAGGERRREAAALLWLRRGWRKAKAKARSEPCRLSDLTRLRNLRKLSIFSYGASGDAHDELGQLSACNALRSLTITWAASNGAGTLPPGGVGQPDAATGDLPSGLKKLDLRRLPYVLPPSWFAPARLPHLEKLCIRAGALASLGDLDGAPPWRSVETLRLRFMRELACEWEALHRWFPQLRVLEHWQCRNLSKWRREIGGGTEAEMRYVEVNHIQDFFFGDQNLSPWDTECDERGIWRRRQKIPIATR